MKQFLKLSCFLLILAYSTEIYSQCNGMTLSNQGQINTFASFYGCTEIEGNLTINGGNDLVNLIGLQGLTSISGDLIIEYNPFLSNLNGLQNLTNVGGSVQIENNGTLTSLEGLQNLSNLGWSIRIIGNSQLSSIESLEGITSVGNLTITSNYGLSDLTGLQNLVYAQGGLSIENNINLQSLDGLQNIAYIGGGLLLEDNPDLISIEALQNLDTVGISLKILDNDALTSLEGIQNISYIGFKLEIANNYLLNICCPAIGLIDEDEEDLIITNNAPNCSSLETVFLSCANVSIQAQAFYDENENGVLDENEQNLNQSFSLNPSAIYTFTDEDEIAHLLLENYGEYELSYNAHPLWELNGTNDTIQISYLDSTFSDSLHYFPLSPVANFTIQEVDLVSSITRCNQQTNYWLTYANKGTSITDGYVNLIADDLTTFVSANPPADSIAGDTLFWFYEDLYPTHSKQIQLIYEMPNVNSLGLDIDFEAGIQTNEGYGDNKAILSSELVCAYDPNDKLVSPNGYGLENYALFGDTLEYTIRFQNTGNDTAFIVVIEDKLSEYLDLNSFSPIASSHPVETRIDGNTRIATFTFKDIYLPDSFVNEVASHGFVKYRILGNEILNENTVIENTASIFFDENPPIVTNTVSNQLVSELPELPVLTVSPPYVNFGELPFDELPYAEPQILVIENPGELELVIESIQVEQSAFTINIDNLIISGQNSIEIPIQFTPYDSGDFIGFLQIESNAGIFTVPMIGTALVGTDLNSIGQEHLHLFPNPNEGQFSIETSNGQILSYQIINTVGQIIQQEESNADFINVDLNKQNAGLYFIRIQTNYGIFVEKIILR